MRALCTRAFWHVELFARKVEAIGVRKCVRRRGARRSFDMAGFGKDNKIE
jgi:hypothetical protein